MPAAHSARHHSARGSRRLPPAPRCNRPAAHIWCAAAKLRSPRPRRRERRTWVGLRPTTRVTAAGGGIEPPVSVPPAPAHSIAATAAAEPPEEPPGTSGVFEPRRRQGEITGPKAEVSFDEPMANSSLLSLPSSTAPSRQRLAVTLDSWVGTDASTICEQAG